MTAPSNLVDRLLEIAAKSPPGRIRSADPVLAVKTEPMKIVAWLMAETPGNQTACTWLAEAIVSGASDLYLADVVSACRVLPFGSWREPGAGIEEGFLPSDFRRAALELEAAYWSGRTEVAEILSRRISGNLLTTFRFEEHWHSRADEIEFVFWRRYFEPGGALGTEDISYMVTFALDSWSRHKAFVDPTFLIAMLRVQLRASGDPGSAHDAAVRLRAWHFTSLRGRPRQV